MKTTNDDLDKYIEKALKKDPSLKTRLKKAGDAWEIAFQIINFREKTGLTQTKLAELIGTRQSNIARIESADYTAYTLKTLEKIAKAFNAKLEIKIIPLEKAKVKKIRSKPFINSPLPEQVYGQKS